MAFIHFVLSENSSVSKYHCQVDGLQIIFFKDGEYVEVNNGRHVISFESEEGIRWDLQFEAKENHCIEIQMMLAPGDSLMGIKIVGEPTYDVLVLDNEQISQIRYTIKEQSKAKDRRTKRTVFAVLSGFCFALTLLFAVNSFTIPALLIPGAICAVGGIALLIARKKI